MTQQTFNQYMEFKTKYAPLILEIAALLAEREEDPVDYIEDKISKEWPELDALLVEGEWWDAAKQGMAAHGYNARQGAMRHGGRFARWGAGKLGDLGMSGLRAGGRLGMSGLRAGGRLGLSGLRTGGKAGAAVAAGLGSGLAQGAGHITDPAFGPEARFGRAAKTLTKLAQFVQQQIPDAMTTSGEPLGDWLAKTAGDLRSQAGQMPTRNLTGGFSSQNGEENPAAAPAATPGASLDPAELDALRQQHVGDEWKRSDALSSSKRGQETKARKKLVDV